MDKTAEVASNVSMEMLQDVCFSLSIQLRRCEDAWKNVVYGPQPSAETSPATPEPSDRFERIMSYLQNATDRSQRLANSIESRV